MTVVVLQISVLHLMIGVLMWYVYYGWTWHASDVVKSFHILINSCLKTFRSKSGDSHQCQRHREHTAGAWHAQILERKTPCTQETGESSDLWTSLLHYIYPKILPSTVSILHHPVLQHSSRHSADSLSLHSSLNNSSHHRNALSQCHLSTYSFL